MGNYTVLLRFANNESETRSSIIKEVRAIDDQLEVEIRSLKEQYAAFIKPKKRNSAIMFSTGIIMFIIAVTGMYAVAKDAITYRMREIGIRMVLGATTGDIAKLLIKSGVKIAAAGIAVGMFLAWIAARVILSETSVIDAPGLLSYICISIMQVIIMAAAWYFPIRKAIKSEPMQLIKYE
jgi:ABC-type antimicrobial peptide transport system permease subunit